MTEIYRCISETLESEYELDDEQIKTLKGIRDKIEFTVPNLDELINDSSRQEFEQSL